MHATKRLQEISEKILNQTRTDLYLSLHFLGESLDSLPWQMDLSTTGIGTDAEFIRYNPRFLMQTYLQEPKWMARTYLHIVLHCLLLHPMAEIPNIVVDRQTNAAVDFHAENAGTAAAAHTDTLSLLQSFIDAARPPKTEPDRILWNLACDIAVESIIDSLEDCPAVSPVISPAG